RSELAEQRRKLLLQEPPGFRKTPRKVNNLEPGAIGRFQKSTANIVNVNRFLSISPPTLDDDSIIQSEMSSTEEELFERANDFFAEIENEEAPEEPEPAIKFHVNESGGQSNPTSSQDTVNK